MSVRTPPVVWRRREARYKLVGSKCDSCERVYYPPLKVCPSCGEEMKSVELPREGRLISYSVVYAASKGARDRSPVVLGLIELGPARIVAEITDVLPEELRPGMEVEAVFRRLDVDGEEGIIAYGIKFRPRLST